MENFYEKLSRKIYNLLLKEVKDRMKILDVGCGDCEIDFYLAQKRRYLKILGIDLGIPKIIKKVKNSFVKCIKGDASTLLNSKKEKFDIVISKYSLHEFSKPRKVLESCYKVLKENGKIIIIDFIKNSLAEKLWGEDYFSIKQIKKMLKELKFKEIKGYPLTKEGPAIIMGLKITKFS